MYIRRLGVLRLGAASGSGPARSRIGVTPSSISIECDVDSGLVVAGFFLATDNGPGSLSGLQYSSNKSWLSLELVRAADGWHFTVTVDTSQIVVGANSATVTLTDANADDPETFSIDVTGTTADPGVVAEIQLSQSTVTLNLQEGNPNTDAHVVKVSSATATPLANPVVGTISGSGGSAVSVVRSGSGPTYDFTITGSPTGLVAASSPYSATVPIQDGTASNSPQNVSVTLNVDTPTPQMALSAPSVTWTVTEGSGATKSTTVTVTSANGAPLGTTSTGTITGSGAAAVSVSTLGHVVTVDFSLGAFAEGNYIAYIPIYNSGSANSPLTFTVYFAVDPVIPASYDINGVIHLFSSSPGTDVLVAGGWPLRPGDLTAADITARKFSIFIGGTEQSIFLEAMPGKHPDGSIRSVLYQFYTPIPDGTPLAAQVKIRATRSTTDRGPLDMTPGVCWTVTPGAAWGDSGDICAKLLPDDVDYACATEPTFEPLIPSADMDASEVARYDTHMQARANGLRSVTLNKNATSVQTFKSTYDSPRALFALWARTGDVTWYRDGMALLYRMIEWGFPTPSYGWNPTPNLHAEARFAANSDWAEQYSQRLWSYAAGWQLSGYAPFYTRVNASHQNANSALRDTYAEAIALNGDFGYIHPNYSIRPNVFKATRHLAAYCIGANRKTTSPSGYGNRNMNFPVELPLVIDAWYVNRWNRSGDWRNDVCGIYHGNTDGTGNNAPHPEDFPTFQLSLANNFMIMLEHNGQGDSRLPGMIKANVTALLLNTRALITGDLGYGTAHYGAPYWMNRNGPASQGFGGAATPVYFMMDAAAISYCAAKWPSDVVNGATFETWYYRAIDPDQNKYVSAVQQWDFDRFDFGWKVFGEQYGYSQSGPYYRVNGVPTGPASVQDLAVPTNWPR